MANIGESITVIASVGCAKDRIIGVARTPTSTTAKGPTPAIIPTSSRSPVGIHLQLAKVKRLNTGTTIEKVPAVARVPIIIARIASKFTPTCLSTPSAGHSGRNTRHTHQPTGMTSVPACTTGCTVAACTPTPACHNHAIIYAIRVGTEISSAASSGNKLWNSSASSTTPIITAFGIATFTSDVDVVNLTGSYGDNRSDRCPHASPSWVLYSNGWFTSAGSNKSHGNIVYTAWDGEYLQRLRELEVNHLFIRRCWGECWRIEIIRRTRCRRQGSGSHRWTCGSHCRIGRWIGRSSGGSVCRSTWPGGRFH